MAVITCDKRNFKITLPECEGIITAAYTHNEHCPHCVVIPFTRDGEEYEFTVPVWFDQGVYKIIMCVRHHCRPFRTFSVMVYVEGNKPSTESTHTPTPGVWDGDVIQECCKE